MIVGESPPLEPHGRIALVGAGSFGRFCLDAYRKSGDIDVVAVADPDPSARAQVEAPGAQIVASWDLLTSNDCVEVIHVATPPFVREAVVGAALAAGKSVFCEKPLALSLPEADRMIDEAQRNGVALGVNYVMRHLPAYDLLQRLAFSGRLGELRTISFQNFAQLVPAGHWFWDRARSGGILVEHGVHFFDAYGHIAGPPEEVWGTIPRPEAVDVGVRYAGGTIGRFYHEFAFPAEVERATGTSFFARGYIEVEGWIPTRVIGAVELSEREVQNLLAYPGIETTMREGATHVLVSFPDRSEQYQSAIAAGMRDVVRSHRRCDYRMKVAPEDARRSLALALAAQEAATRQERTRIS
jgi:predicted dehydrogenase